MGGGPFAALFQFSIFGYCLWGVGRLFRKIGISQLIGQIAVGIVLGPNLMNYLPDSYTICRADKMKDWGDQDWQGEITSTYTVWCDQEVSKGEYSDRDTCLEAKGNLLRDKYCLKNPDTFTLLGHFGVSLLLFESGLHFDFEKAWAIGPRALAIGLMGTVLPLLVGAFMTKQFLMDDNEPSMAPWAVGVTLAPTSVGISLKLLMESHALSSTAGQTIISSAFIDDIFSLVLFEVLFQMQDNGGKITTSALMPGVYGFVFLAVGAWLATSAFPKIVNKQLHKIKEMYPKSSQMPNFPPANQALCFLEFGVILAYAYITHLFGSHLWGCFVAGMTFAKVHGAVYTWTYQTKRITTWLLALFFAGTVGFGIPVKEMAKPEAIWKGLLMGWVAAVGMKILACVWLPENKWVVGWAMCGRAEFAYLIAQMAKSQGMMSDRIYAIVVWALFVATLVAPFGFNYYLRKAMKIGIIEEDDDHLEHEDID